MSRLGRPRNEWWAGGSLRSQGHRSPIWRHSRWSASRLACRPSPRSILPLAHTEALPVGRPRGSRVVGRSALFSRSLIRRRSLLSRRPARGSLRSPLARSEASLRSVLPLTQPEASLASLARTPLARLATLSPVGSPGSRIVDRFAHCSRVAVAPPSLIPRPPCGRPRGSSLRCGAGLRLGGFESLVASPLTRYSGRVAAATRCSRVVAPLSSPARSSGGAPCGPAARLAGVLGDARGGIRTHGPLQERILSPPPLSGLGHPRGRHRRTALAGKVVSVVATAATGGL